MPEQLQDMGVLVPHFLMMRDPRVMPVADRMWEKAAGDRDKMVDIVFEFITTNIYYITDEELFHRSEGILTPWEVITGGMGDCGNSSIAMESLLFYKQIPSRMVFGYALGNSHRWVEAQTSDGVWRVYDTTTGQSFPTTEREQHGYDALFFVTPFSFALAKLQFLPPLFLP